MVILDVRIEKTDQPVLYQVMPLVILSNGVDLNAYLHTICLQKVILLYVAKRVLKEFAALHNTAEHMAHLDFKPANLVIDAQKSVCH